MKNKDNMVGIVGYWFATNYGGVASYFSLYKAIESLGFLPVLIETPYLASDKEGLDTFPRKFFKEMNVRISACYTLQELAELNDLANTFVLGSDQVLTTSSIRIFGKLFLMEFAQNDKKKIAVSASCGGDNLNANEEIVEYAKKQLLKFDAVSVREYTAVDIVKNKFGINAEMILDPIFLTSKEKYQKIVFSKNTKCQDNYMLAYILDPTADKKKCIEDISKKLELSRKILLDGRKFTYEQNLKLMDMSEDTLPEADFTQWLYYFSQASYILTDSFHGAAMAIILNKPFIMYANHKRGYPRFLTLVQMFGMKSRLIESSMEVKEQLLNEAIDYDAVNSTIGREKEKAFNWLRNALEAPIDEMPSTILPDKAITTILDKNNCVGCSACVNACPTGALTLEPDNLGYYRAVLHPEKCINCGKCKTVCPAHKLPEKRNAQPKCYEFISADKELLEKSSSGGIFGVLAGHVLKKGGVVCGAAWKDDFSVEHILIDSAAELTKLQKSKYLQSYMGNIPKQIKDLLDSGRQVLFSGCPCQVAGLLSFLEKDYSNLVTIDLLCGNAPSTMFFQKYIKEEFPDGIQKYEFRRKVQGWNADCVAVTVTDGRTEVRRGGAQDHYQRVYHNHLMCAPHCEQCQYQAAPRYGDITIGDFWWLNSKDTSVNTKDGVSAVLINNAKGEQLFAEIPDEMIEVKKEVPVEWLSGNGFVKGNKNWCAPARDAFYIAIQTMDFKAASDYALKPNHNFTLNDNKHTVLNHSSGLYHFRYDPNVWQETELFGYQTLMVKPGESKVGRYACLPLYETLCKGKKYRLYFRFKIKSESPILNLHIKDSGTNCYQFIHTHRISQADNWEVADVEFIPQSDIFDEFMLGASQVKGKGNYLCIDCIRITEAE